MTIAFASKLNGFKPLKIKQSVTPERSVNASTEGDHIQGEFVSGDFAVTADLGILKF
jgi:hypothetical protein